jgi:hypothetical protein
MRFPTMPAQGAVLTAHVVTSGSTTVSLPGAGGE